MNIFSALRVYEGRWNPSNERPFTAEEVSNVSLAVVVEGDYGLSVRMDLCTGGCSFIPLDSGSVSAVGEVIDLSKVKLITLSKAGKEDIYRIRL